MPTDLPPMIVGLPMAFALGLVFGMGPCLLSCLPYLGPVFLGLGDGGMRHSWRVLLPLSLGRLCAYGALGAVSGWFGLQVADQMHAPSVQLSLGCALVMVGGVLWRRAGHGACAVPRPAVQPIRWMPPRTRAPSTRATTPASLLPGGLFLMGLGMTLNPCAPLGVVLFSAAASASVADGMGLGLGFGLGAITVPSLIYGVGVAYMAAQLRQHLGRWLPWLERASAGLMLLTGVKLLGVWGLAVGLHGGV